jgi:hypothetical protein
MNTTTSLINRINSIDPHYDMSDDHTVWTKWNNEEKAIQSELKRLSNEEVREVAGGLNENGKLSFTGSVVVDHVESLPKPKNETRVTVMSTAWAMLKKGLFATISEALKAAWKRIKLIKSLRSGVAYFAYAKATGELREAIGTLRHGNFSYEAKTDKKNGNVHVVKYFDLQAQAFRSCRVDRLITVKAA